MAKNPDFRSVVAGFLKEFDALLAADQVPLNRRALRAAMFFAEEVVEDVSVGTKSNPIGQRWFDALHAEISRWYARRYGDAMNQNPDGASRGLVVLGGAPFSLSFPLTVVRPGSHSGTRRIHFPSRLMEHEKALAFLDTKVSLRRFTKKERAQLEEDIRAVVADTRELNRALRFADVNQKGQQLASRAMWTVRQAVESIAGGSADRRGLAVWELNLVAELCLKVFLHSREVAPRPIHVVRSLHDDAVAAGLSPFSAAKLAKFPSGRNAIRSRYGDRAVPSVANIMELYQVALSLALHAASQCKRHLSVQHDGWIEVRTIGSQAAGTGG